MKNINLHGSSRCYGSVQFDLAPIVYFCQATRYHQLCNMTIDAIVMTDTHQVILIVEELLNQQS